MTLCRKVLSTDQTLAISLLVQDWTVYVSAVLMVGQPMALGDDDSEHQVKRRWQISWSVSKMQQLKPHEANFPQNRTHSFARPSCASCLLLNSEYIYLIPRLAGSICVILAYTNVLVRVWCLCDLVLIAICRCAIDTWGPLSTLRRFSLGALAAWVSMS